MGDPSNAQVAAQIASDFGQMGLGHALNRSNAKYAYQKQKDWARFGPTHMMAGYRKAGINPILVAQGGWKGASTGNSMMPAATQTVGNAASRSQAATAKDVSKSQKSNLDANAKAANAQAIKNMVDANVSIASQRKANAEANEAELRMQFLNTPKGREAFYRSIELEGIPNNLTSGLGVGLGELGTAKDALEDAISSIGNNWPGFKKGLKDRIAAGVQRGMDFMDSDERAFRKSVKKHGAKFWKWDW